MCLSCMPVARLCRMPSCQGRQILAVAATNHILQSRTTSGCMLSIWTLCEKYCKTGDMIGIRLPLSSELFSICSVSEAKWQCDMSFATY